MSLPADFLRFFFDRRERKPENPRERFSLSSSDFFSTDIDHKTNIIASGQKPPDRDINNNNLNDLIELTQTFHTKYIFFGQFLVLFYKIQTGTRQPSLNGFKSNLNV